MLLVSACAATSSLNTTFLNERQLSDDAYLGSRAGAYPFWGTFYDVNDSAFHAVNADSATLQAFVFGINKYRESDSLGLLPRSEYVHIRQIIDADFQILEAKK